MNNLYEALEICLQNIQQGADIETVLLRYPDLADELRPILESSVSARKMVVPAPSDELVRRNRAKVLQHAAQMREAKAKSSQRLWFSSLRRLAVTLAVLIVLSVSGTGLVQAASTTLPGDNLYPVKRTWEDVLLAITFNVQQRDALEVEHENERLHELDELFAEGRSAEVDFAGSVTSQNGSEWMVSGVTVVTSAQTEIRGQGIAVGSAVRVKGQTQGNNVVLAERIELLPAGAKLPDISDDHEIEAGNQNGSNQQTEENSGTESETEAPKVEETQTQEAESGQEGESVNDGSSNSDGSNNNEGSSNNSNDSSTNEDPNHDSNSGSNSNDSHDDSNQNSNDSGGGGSNSGSGGSGGGD